MVGAAARLVKTVSLPVCWCGSTQVGQILEYDAGMFERFVTDVLGVVVKQTVVLWKSIHRDKAKHWYTTMARILDGW